MATIRVIAVPSANAEAVRYRQNDIGRTLTTLGQKQVLELHAKLGTIDLNRVYASSTTRAMQTAIGVTGLRTDEIERIPELYVPDGSDGESLTRLLIGLGPKAPRVYINHSENDGCVQRFSKAAGDALVEHLNKDEKDGIVAIFGDAVLLQLAFLSLAHRKDLHDHFLELDLEETEAFEAIIVDGVVTEVKFLNLDD